MATERYQIGLAAIDGGNLRNAIAREAWADIVVDAKSEADLQALVAEFGRHLAFEFRSTEPGLTVEITPIETPQLLIDSETQHKLLNVLLACAHGVLAMSREIPNFVETSTNLASINLDEELVGRAAPGALVA